ncbi:Hypothetical predicted protein [Mytilus galloprovincialis]|uniref:Uncharacterized protein n=1 Tax=Mytilus galloprovincialis TaxID=29158 RepID=A0A8B6CGB5_MYTGA|nr:Hypothetical predicted protein [Mytilus galloprovincialis]
MTVGKGFNKFEKAIKNQRMNSLASQEYPGMEPEQSLAKPLKSRDSKQDLYQVNRADYISRAMTVGRGVNNFEKAIKNQRVNSLASQEYPYQPEPPHSERTEISRRQSYASNMVSRKSSLHPNDAFHEPYGMERALSPAQMTPSGFNSILFCPMGVSISAGKILLQALSTTLGIVGSQAPWTWNTPPINWNAEVSKKVMKQGATKRGCIDGGEMKSS